jgi:hypothetical protein
MRAGQFRGERLEHAQFGQQRAAVVHVDLVFAGPVEGLARLDLQSRKVNAVLANQPDVTNGQAVVVPLLLRAVWFISEICVAIV